MNQLDRTALCGELGIWANTCHYIVGKGVNGGVQWPQCREGGGDLAPLVLHHLEVGGKGRQANLASPAWAKAALIPKFVGLIWIYYDSCAIMVHQKVGITIASIPSQCNFFTLETIWDPFTHHH
ncbi:hypothetical protein BDA96_04G106300 [Sorghum bicolor]|uniref:Uncharacterized protein n=2 Tax=Sorghum bicolor TaxID=4558 RepID=A0A921R2R3_SORBI|nr:hypothetical protein BDA96_06G300500 [Sorghum bicolor]KAG0532427.1 hypothetical protein BDA96_04G106300 [Sorghum bicolor]KXG29843.1 hypothetical protein SORBI_3004G098400 [Sorghum bicolor]